MYLGVYIFNALAVEVYVNVTVIDGWISAGFEVAT